MLQEVNADRVGSDVSINLEIDNEGKLLEIHSRRDRSENDFSSRNTFYQGNSKMWLPRGAGKMAAGSSVVPCSRGGWSHFYSVDQVPRCDRFDENDFLPWNIFSGKE